MPQEKPNVLLIMTDQHRLSALGCYGETPCKTPNLDRLAARGFRFETAYTTFPVCTPARASVITGHFPHRHGMTSNTDNIGASVHELQDRPQLLSRRLLAAGYRCGYTGKWHLGTEWDSIFDQPTTPSLPRHVGFEGQNFPGHGAGGFYYDEYKQYLAEHGWKHEAERKQGPATRGCGILKGPLESTVPYYLAEHTLGLLERYREAPEPFFIWHNFWGPHSPYLATQEYYDMYRDVPMPEWPSYRWDEADPHAPASINRPQNADAIPWEEMADAVRHYYAFTTMIDGQVGRMLDGLERMGLADDTIIIFTADHGESLGDHGGIRDKGWTHFEETQRIPLIVCLPERFAPGRERGTALSEFASLCDVYPTICDAAGADYDPADLHGRSLLPLLRGTAESWREEVFVEFFGLASLTGTLFTCRHGDLKYGWNAGARDELYDLARDPFELHNAVDDPQYAGVREAMQKRIGDWLERTDFNRAGLNTYRRATGQI